MFRTAEELADLLQGTKETVDAAYDATCSKHGSEVANAAIMTFFRNSVLQYFTRDNNARSNMEELLYRDNEIYQILADYAISSYILNEMECDLSHDDLSSYVRDMNGELDYSGTRPIKVLALASTVNNYWALNILSVNKKLKSELLGCFIQERYVDDKRFDLDNTPSIRLVRFPDEYKPVFMSKTRLNDDVRNMNSDDMLDDYVPPTRRNSASTK